MESWWGGGFNSDLPSRIDTEVA